MQLPRLLKFKAKKVNSTNISLNIFHHNIRGLNDKHDELIQLFQLHGINPHILCLTKYHMVEQDLLHLTLEVIY
jgi:hypothetical protein